MLWLIGHSERQIAAAARLRVKQVAGIIAASTEFKDRRLMTDLERQAKVDMLLAQPSLGERFKHGRMLIMPLNGRQRRTRQHETPP